MRKYPDELTPAQRRMVRSILANPHYRPSRGRTQTRFEGLITRGFIQRRSDGGYEPSEPMLDVVTYFVQEEITGPVKIGVTYSKVIVQKLQLGNPRKLRLLGALDGDRMNQIKGKAKPHALGGGWYSPHADVLAWTRHKDFRRS